MSLESIAQSVADMLSEQNIKLVLAESCTAGLISATLGAIPGISNNFCGSAVTYRADTKQRWLSLSDETIRVHTTESHTCARDLAKGVLDTTPEANWAMSIVGHLGPGAPAQKDGKIYICIARMTKKGNFKIKAWMEEQLSSPNRVGRQKEAVEVALSRLYTAMRTHVRTKKIA